MTRPPQFDCTTASIIPHSISINHRIEIGEEDDGNRYRGDIPLSFKSKDVSRVAEAIGAADWECYLLPLLRGCGRAVIITDDDEGFSLFDDFVCVFGWSIVFGEFPAMGLLVVGMHWLGAVAKVLGRWHLFRAMNLATLLS